MGPDIWVLIAAVFVSGGAVGSAGTLLAQWLLGKVTGPEAARPDALSDRDGRRLSAEVADLTLRFQNLDARLDFQEQLLGGALPTTRPPARLPEVETPFIADGESEGSANDDDGPSPP